MIFCTLLDLPTDCLKGNGGDMELGTLRGLHERMNNHTGCICLTLTWRGGFGKRPDFLRFFSGPLPLVRMVKFSQDCEIQPGL